MKVKHIRAYLALKEVAEKEGTTVEQVMQSINKAIRDAYIASLRENNRAAIREWESIPCRGDLPDALELITYLDAKVKEKIK